MSAPVERLRDTSGVFPTSDAAYVTNSTRPAFQSVVSAISDTSMGDAGDKLRGGAGKSAMPSRQLLDPSPTSPTPQLKQPLNPESHIQAATEDHMDDNRGHAEALSAGRKNVQFAPERQDIEAADSLQSRSSPLSEPNTDTRSRSQLLYSKLRALKTSPTSFSHDRPPNTLTINSTLAYAESEGPLFSPLTEHDEPYFPTAPEVDSTGTDAGAEESAPDPQTDNTPQRKKRRKSRMVHKGGIETAPTSPQVTRHPVPRTHPQVTTDVPRPGALPRRATDTETSPHGQPGTSDDESRNQAGHESPWKRRAAWRGLSYNSGTTQE